MILRGDYSFFNKRAIQGGQHRGILGSGRVVLLVAVVVAREANIRSP
jgi:hypothetical protein